MALYRSFQNVWLASDDHARSLTRWTTFSDYGRLDSSSDQLIFYGQATTLTLNNIRSIALAYLPIPWIAYGFSGLLLIGTFIGFAFLLGSTLESSTAIALLTIAVLAAITITGLGVMIVRRTPWIAIRYLDRDQNVKQIYIADGSQTGWGGVFGGTQRMYQMLRELSLSNKSGE